MFNYIESLNSLNIFFVYLNNVIMAVECVLYFLYKIVIVSSTVGDIPLLKNIRVMDKKRGIY